ncbi:MAG: hypothetical protein MJE77_20365 [Proteobacteria bacterium]|nr:hypothetical protein [Pseudomonadota bacterium]
MTTEQDQTKTMRRTAPREFVEGSTARAIGKRFFRISRVKHNTMNMPATLAPPDRMKYRRSTFSKNRKSTTSQIFSSQRTGNRPRARFSALEESKTTARYIFSVLKESKTTIRFTSPGQDGLFDNRLAQGKVVPFQLFAQR